MPLRRLRTALHVLKLREFALAQRCCPFCGPSVIVRLCADELGVRCLRCGASAVHLSLGWAMRKHAATLKGSDVCELSARGPFTRYLRGHARSVALSEYFADVPRGESRADVRCEDVQQLSYADASFDLVTHTEVLEHVPEDARAFAELRRVLRPGGLMLFSVPLHGGARTLERAHLQGGEVRHLLAPVYHCDPLRGGAGILAFRDYGGDILERLRHAGFAQAWIEKPSAEAVPWGYARPVVCARC